MTTLKGGQKVELFYEGGHYAYTGGEGLSATGLVRTREGPLGVWRLRYRSTGFEVPAGLAEALEWSPGHPDDSLPFSEACVAVKDKKLATVPCSGHAPAGSSDPDRSHLGYVCEARIQLTDDFPLGVTGAVGRDQV